MRTETFCAKSESPAEDDGTDKWTNDANASVSALLPKHSGEIDAIGAAAPGLAADDNQSIEHLPNRSFGLENFNWGNFLKFPAFVLNDAHAAAFSEKSFGAAADFKDFVLSMLGTGVGGGVAANGALVQGLSQMAGHLGHTLANAHGSKKASSECPAVWSTMCSVCRKLGWHFGACHWESFC